MDDDDRRLPLTPALQTELAQRCGRPDGSLWRDLGGSWSTNLGVGRPGGPDELVIRIHQRFVTEDRVRAEQHTRRRLSDLGLPTVVALPMFDGDTVARLGSGNLIEAEPFVVADANMDSPDRLIRGFAMLGRVHDALRSSTLPTAAHHVTHANHLDAELGVERARLGRARIQRWHDAELGAFADRAVAHLVAVDALERPLLAGGRRQVCHGDFWDNNVLFRDGSGGRQIAAILDLGFMSERARIDDLALPIWFLLLGEPGSAPGDHLDTIAAMVAAYDAATTAPLTLDERRALPLAVARQPAWIVGRWVIDEPDEQEAREHTRRAAEELPVATEVLDQLSAWRHALGVR